ncbi:RNA polymerase recycling motor ATPase HelR [Nocardiopsis alba]|uniref:RNA polymerase recycling motor ATPase HelR n=1 Tax=Nocardiopsis alba TaxID=53437 RepID=UPI0033E1BA8D
MKPATTSAFDLPDHLAAKADPALIAADERHFDAITTTLRRTITDLTHRLDTARTRTGGTGREVLERDQEIRRLTTRLRTLNRFGLDLCLGHIVHTHDPQPLYIGRLGLTDEEGHRLLIDWRSPAAEPFFAATHATPMGLESRRRYRWNHGHVTDYWDEVFTDDAIQGHAALDDQSAFIAELGTHRSPRMRDVLSTIQADQDAIIRAGSEGALVVDGGPGTGKTVVALHRTAHLLYSDPRLGHHRGGVLFIGPHRPYLAYIADVLPGLGEEGVQTRTLNDLVPEGADALPETDPNIAHLKSTARMIEAIEPAVRFYERPPEQTTTLTTDHHELTIDASHWAHAYAALDPATPHNEAREEILDHLLQLLTEHHPDPELTTAHLRAALPANPEPLEILARAWPLLEPTDLVNDLWTVPAYLRLCAPWLTTEQIHTLQRAPDHPWTTQDLPLLDAARRRLGDPESARETRRHKAREAAERERMSLVIDDLIASDHDGEGLMTMLHGQDLRNSLVDHTTPPHNTPDRLTGPFAHIVVDEAQEPTDAQWRMLLARCPSRSLTIVGDRAQARHGFTETWHERLRRVGLDRVHLTHLSINYRTPREVMTEAEPVIRAALPDANVPTSIRAAGIPITHGPTTDLKPLLDTWKTHNTEGTACVIGDPTLPDTPRVRSLPPHLVKGLEFDLVVLIDPHRFGDDVQGAVDRYVAMTRATRRLVILTTP